MTGPADVAYPGRAARAPRLRRALGRRYALTGRRGKELNLLPLPCAGSALPMSYAPLCQSIRLMIRWAHGRLWAAPSRTVDSHKLAQVTAVRRRTMRSLAFTAWFSSD